MVRVAAAVPLDPTALRTIRVAGRPAPSSSVPRVARRLPGAVLDSPALGTLLPAVVEAADLVTRDAALSLPDAAAVVLDAPTVVLVRFALVRSPNAARLRVPRVLLVAILDDAPLLAASTSLAFGNRDAPAVVVPVVDEGSVGLMEAADRVRAGTLRAACVDTIWCVMVSNGLALWSAYTVMTTRVTHARHCDIVGRKLTRSGVWYLKSRALAMRTL